MTRLVLGGVRLIASGKLLNHQEMRSGRAEIIWGFGLELYRVVQARKQNP